MMFHRADVYRPTITQGTGQKISGYTLTYGDVPVFIQPADSQLAFYYAQRGTVMTHTIYTSDTAKTFTREDVLEDADGNQYHLVAAPVNGLRRNVYLELHCEQYPEDAKVRLDMGEYA